jgi:hypothetical protein
LVESGLVIEVGPVDAVDLLDVPGGDFTEQGVERVAGGEMVQAQEPGQCGLAGQGAVDVADANDPGDEDRHQGHQLVHRLEVGVGGGRDRHALEPLRQIEPVEVAEDDGEEAPAGEGGGGVFDGDGVLGSVIGSRTGHRYLPEDQ